MTLEDLPLDSEGFLTDLSLWNEDVASLLADQDSIELSPQHFEIIHLIRKFYQEHQVSIANRPLVKLVKNELGAEKGSSIYLMQLFPESPAKFAAKIAGLPKPANCL